jgi:hypothetical protein
VVRSHGLDSPSVQVTWFRGWPLDCKRCATGSLKVSAHRLDSRPSISAIAFGVLQSCRRLVAAIATNVQREGDRRASSTSTTFMVPRSIEDCRLHPCCSAMDL